MKIETVIADAEREVNSLKRSIRRDRDDVEEIIDFAKRQGRQNLTEPEDRQAEEIFSRIQRNRDALDRVEAKLGRAQAVKTETDEQEKRLEEVRPTNAGREFRASPRTTSFSVTRNERTYHPGRDIEAGFRNQPGGAFLLDVSRAFMNDPMAQDRLKRHMLEEYAEKPWLEERSSGTTNFVGLTVPAYLVEEAAPAVSAARPLADVMASKELPVSGMSVNLSRITTPTAAGIQATQNTTVANQDISDSLLTLNVQTAAGYVQLSRQAVERGVLTEDVTTTDLLKRVAVALDAQLLSQATVGLAATATSQSYVNATVDTTAIPAFMKQLIQAQNSVETTLLAQASPSHFVMSPRRYNWATAAVSSSWPVFSGTTVPPQSGAMMLTNEYGPSVRAVLNNGMKVTVDGNVTTQALGTALTGGTQDHVYCITAAESYLYEPPQRTIMIRAEQPQAAQLGILFVAYEYFAFTFQRYTGQSVLVNGTGLATPSFE